MSGHRLYHSLSQVRRQTVLGFSLGSPIQLPFNQMGLSETEDPAEALPSFERGFRLSSIRGVCLPGCTAATGN